MKETLIVKTAKTHNNKTFWIPIGRAFVKRKPGGDIEDVGIVLDALPISGALRAWPYDANDKKNNTKHETA